MKFFKKNNKILSALDILEINCYTEFDMFYIKIISLSL